MALPTSTPFRPQRLAVVQQQQSHKDDRHKGKHHECLALPLILLGHLEGFLCLDSHGSCIEHVALFLFEVDQEAELLVRLMVVGC